MTVVMTSRETITGLDYFGARYFSSAQGRFTTPDEFKGGIVDPFTGQDIETNTALPYADIADPQTLNKYAYVRNNPLRYIDPDGHAPSDLVYDGDAHTLTLYSGTGEEIGSWPAANNVAVQAPPGEGDGYTKGPTQEGTYSVVKGDQYGATMHLGLADNSKYGSQGIIHFSDVKGATGQVVVGFGVHSGRTGPEAKTGGCVRTCTDAMRTINKVAKTDPLKTLTVKNNQANIDSWRKQAAAMKAAEKKRLKKKDGQPNE